MFYISYSPKRYSLTRLRPRLRLSVFRLEALSARLSPALLGSRTMAGTCIIKLVGPDMPVDGLKLTIEATGTIAQLRATAHAQLPAPAGLALPDCPLPELRVAEVAI